MLNSLGRRANTHQLVLNARLWHGMMCEQPGEKEVRTPPTDGICSGLAMCRFEYLVRKMMGQFRCTPFVCCQACLWMSGCVIMLCESLAQSPALHFLQTHAEELHVVSYVCTHLWMTRFWYSYWVACRADECYASQAVNALGSPFIFFTFSRHGRFRHGKRACQSDWKR